MGIINFKLRFITPLLIHGVDSRKCDSIGLTGKALRGSWRFWFRALMGGMVTNARETLLDLEGKVFGSSNEETGAKFRLILEEVTKPETISAYMGFNYKGSRAGQQAISEGYKEGLTYKITIIPRKNMENEELKALLATIWLWANLGGIGLRGRRGFGSSVIEVEEKNNPYKEHFPNYSLPIKQSFKNSKELEDYLKNGVKTSQEAFHNLYQKKSSNLVIPILEAHTPPDNPSFFIVSSIKQIAVGKESVGKNLKSAITAVHGNNFCSEMGSINQGRKASPVYIRLHEAASEFYPVVTWSEPKKEGCARNYIRNNCKCEKYLDGSDV